MALTGPNFSENPRRTWKKINKKRFKFIHKKCLSIPFAFSAENKIVANRFGASESTTVGKKRIKHKLG